MTDVATDPQISGVLSAGDGQGSFTCGTEQGTCLVVYQALSVAGWYAVAEYNMNTLLLPSQRFQVILLAVVLVLSIAALAVIYLISRRTYEPIGSLTRALTSAPNDRIYDDVSLLKDAFTGLEAQNLQLREKAQRTYLYSLLSGTPTELTGEEREALNRRFQAGCYLLCLMRLSEPKEVTQAAADLRERLSGLKDWDLILSRHDLVLLWRLEDEGCIPVSLGRTLAAANELGADLFCAEPVHEPTELHAAMVAVYGLVPYGFYLSGCQDAITLERVRQLDSDEPPEENVRQQLLR